MRRQFQPLSTQGRPGRRREEHGMLTAQRDRPRLVPHVDDHDNSAAAQDQSPRLLVHRDIDTTQVGVSQLRQLTPQRSKSPIDIEENRVST